MQIEPNAKAMRYKSWPLLEDWNEIFGKDRATGDHAEDIADAANDMNNEGAAAQDKENEQNSEISHDFTADNEEETSACHNSGSKEAVNKPAGKGKKRKQTDNVSIVASAISEISRATNARLDTIANLIGHEVDMDEARKDAYNSLENVEGLTLHERFEVAEIFVDKMERFLLFKGLPEMLEARMCSAYFRSLSPRNPYMHR